MKLFDKQYMFFSSKQGLASIKAFLVYCVVCTQWTAYFNNCSKRLCEISIQFLSKVDSAASPMAIYLSYLSMGSGYLGTQCRTQAPGTIALWFLLWNIPVCVYMIHLLFSIGWGTNMKTFFANKLFLAP